MKVVIKALCYFCFEDSFPGDLNGHSIEKDEKEANERARGSKKNKKNFPGRTNLAKAKQTEPFPYSCKLLKNKYFVKICVSNGFKKAGKTFQKRSSLPRLQEEKFFGLDKNQGFLFNKTRLGHIVRGGS